MLDAPEPYRTRDLSEHPRFRGWWPPAHPDMRSFLGVPIVDADGVIGAFYLTQKIGADDFDDADEEVIALLAAHAAVAIANARLHEQTRELSIAAERNRLALDLHDSVSQKLFALMLNAEAAARVLERDPAAARERVRTLQELAQAALDELRALVFELRPPELERDGLGGALRKHVAFLRRLEQHEIELVVADGLRPDAARDREILRIAQEALQNAVKHAQARRVTGAARRRRGGARARGGRQRRRLRPRGGRGALAPARPHLDGGARRPDRRHARGPLRPRGRHDGAPADARWLSRSGC